ncbi:hypothetical protein LCGC14_0770300 [marine sediment metagenome]|uniref:Fibronectin type-III domain-containing protein n=1 Tax=marine sediment metagenome TaxID=412755 RepID=A0A0F9PYN1_9ZZZZ
MRLQKKLLTLIVILSVFTIFIFNVNAEGEATAPDAPILNPIIPNVILDGEINLKWNEPEWTSGYEVYYKRSWNDEWILIETITSGRRTFYSYNTIFDGLYEFSVIATGYAMFGNSPRSNIVECNVVILEPVIPDPDPIPLIYPSNPSILINNGNESTSLLDLSLNLACDDADEMQFQISLDMWTNWTSYSTSYILTVTESNLNQRDEFKIEVVFRNENGTTKDAGLGVISDDIKYIDLNGDDEDVPGDGDGDNGLSNDVIIGILVGVIGLLILISIFVKYRKRKNKK